MRLFELIYKASIERDPDALWEIIDRFDPLISRCSRSPFTGRLDEELKSEMQLALARMIVRFNIFKYWGKFK